MTLNFVRGVKNATGYAGIRNMNEVPTHIADEEIEIMITQTQEIIVDLKEGDRIAVSGFEGLEDQEVTIKKIYPKDKKVMVSRVGALEKNEGFQITDTNKEHEVPFSKIEKIKKK